MKNNALLKKLDETLGEMREMDGIDAGNQMYLGLISSELKKIEKKENVDVEDIAYLKEIDKALEKIKEESKINVINQALVKKIETGLEAIKATGRLNLGNHILNTQGLEAIRDLLGDDTDLIEIHASNVGDKEDNLSLDNFEVLLEIIGNSPALRKLTLSNNKLSFDSVSGLTFYLSKHFGEKKISELHVSNCDLSEASVLNILTSRNINELHIHGNNLETILPSSIPSEGIEKVSIVPGEYIIDTNDNNKGLPSPEEECYSQNWSKPEGNVFLDSSFAGEEEENEETEIVPLLSDISIDTPSPQASVGEKALPNPSPSNPYSSKVREILGKNSVNFESFVKRLEEKSATPSNSPGRS